MGRVVIISLVVAATCSAMAAAPQQARRFELISIRQLPPNAPIVMREQGFTPIQPGGRYVDPSTNLFVLIAEAYSIKYPDARLLGLPHWKATRYAIAARAADDFPQLAPADDRQQVRLMMRELLADRFRLRIHTENRQETILRKTVDKSDLQVKEVAAPVPPEREGNVNMALSDSGGRMIGQKATMAGLARAAGLFLRQEVIDDTGLTGYYDFDIRWAATPVPGAPPPAATLGADGIALFIPSEKNSACAFHGRQGRCSIGLSITWRCRLPTESRSESGARGDCKAGDHRNQHGQDTERNADQREDADELPERTLRIKSRFELLTLTAADELADPP
jgi:uncharacterized protein (TIGR03435 family)